MRLIKEPSLFGSITTGIDWGDSGTLAVAGACHYCSGLSSLVWHSGLCPKIKAIDYYQDGSIKHIEFR